MQTQIQQTVHRRCSSVAAGGAAVVAAVTDRIDRTRINRTALLPNDWDAASPPSLPQHQEQTSPSHWHDPARSEEHLLAVVFSSFPSVFYLTV